MIRIPFRIPITIHPFFWLTALIIGFFNSGGNLTGMVMWLGVIFVSVLVHEFGHATTAFLFGLNPSIELVALGGMTVYPSGKLSLWKQFFIVLNGPIFGFLLFGIAWGLLKLQISPTLHQLFTLFFWVNLVWTALNLVPVMPLDGGQLLRIAFEGLFGTKGLKYSLIIGIVVAILLSILFFFLQSFLIGALFFLFAFQSFDLYRQARRMSSEDRSDYFQKAFEEAEEDLQAGNKEKALSEFERIRSETHEGVIRRLATEYLAFLKYEKGESEQAYQLLQSIRADLSGEALCLLHKAALRRKIMHW